MKNLEEKSCKYFQKDDWLKLLNIVSFTVHYYLEKQLSVLITSARMKKIKPRLYALKMSFEPWQYLLRAKKMTQCFIISSHHMTVLCRTDACVFFDGSYIVCASLSGVQTEMRQKRIRRAGKWGACRARVPKIAK
jgi:hypothetical protein